MNTVEEVRKGLDQWVEEFRKAKTEPMDDEMAHVFIKLSMLEQRDEKVPFPEGVFSAQLYLKRNELMQIDISNNVGLLLLSLTKSPGHLTMYMCFLKKMQMSGRVGRIDMEAIANLFPLGFVTDDELDRLWRLQKCSIPRRPDNMVDIFEAYLLPEKDIWAIWADDYMCPKDEIEQAMSPPCARSDDYRLVNVTAYDESSSPCAWEETK